MPALHLGTGCAHGTCSVSHKHRNKTMISLMSLLLWYRRMQGRLAGSLGCHALNQHF